MVNSFPAYHENHMPQSGTGHGPPASNPGMGPNQVPNDCRPSSESTSEPQLGYTPAEGFANQSQYQHRPAEESSSLQAAWQRIAALEYQVKLNHGEHSNSLSAMLDYHRWLQKQVSTVEASISMDGISTRLDDHKARLAAIEAASLAALLDTRFQQSDQWLTNMNTHVAVQEQRLKALESSVEDALPAYIKRADGIDAKVQQLENLITKHHGEMMEKSKAAKERCEKHFEQNKELTDALSRRVGPLENTVQTVATQKELSVIEERLRKIEEQQESEKLPQRMKNLEREYHECVQTSALDVILNTDGAAREKRLSAAVEKRIKKLEGECREFVRTSSLDVILNTDGEARERRVSTMEEKVTTHQAKVDGDISGLRTQLTAIADSAASNIHKRIDDVKGEVTKAVESITTIRTAIKTTTDEEESVWELMDSVQTMIKTLQEEHNQLARTISGNAESSTRETQSCRDDLKANHDLLAEDVKTAREDSRTVGKSVSALERKADETYVLQTATLESLRLAIDEVQLQQRSEQRIPPLSDLPVPEAIRALSSRIPAVPTTKEEAMAINDLMQTCARSAMMYIHGVSAADEPVKMGQVTRDIDQATNGVAEMKRKPGRPRRRPESIHYDTLTGFATPSSPEALPTIAAPTTTSSSNLRGRESTDVEDIVKDVYELFDDSDDDVKEVPTPRRSGRPPAPRQFKGLTSWTNEMAEEIEERPEPNSKKRRLD